MLSRLKQLFVIPPFENPNQQRIASLLMVSVWVLLGTAVVLPIAFLFLLTPPNYLLTLGPSGLLVVLLVPTVWLLHRRRLQAAGIILSSILLLIITLAVFNSRLGISSPSIAGFVVVIILAASLSEGRFAVLIFTFLSILIAAAFFLAERFERLTIQPDTTPLVGLIVYIFVFGLSGVLLNVALRRLGAALERAEKSEHSLRELAQELEVRVADRTRALEAGAEISRRLSTILDAGQLVSEVVREIQRAFGYYHTHIYLLDEQKQELVLAGGTGEVGRMLLAARHKMPLTRGLVGTAAQRRETVLVPDVRQEPLWVPNRLLPETAAEIAIPIVLGKELKGVLDVQHHRVGGLGESDQILLESITNQVAIALENARLYADAQKRGEREALVNSIGQKIQLAGSVEAVLQIAVQELGQALDAQTSRIQIGRIER